MQKLYQRFIFLAIPCGMKHVLKASPIIVSPKSAIYEDAATEAITTTTDILYRLDKLSCIHAMDQASLLFSL